MTQEIIQLVEEAKAGSQRAFTKLYNIFKPSVWYTIQSVVKNTDVADDLLSVVFTKAYIKLQHYTEHISFNMWLKTIAVNTAIDYIRANKKELLNNYIDDENSTVQLDNCDNTPEDKLSLKEEADITMKVLATLQKKYRELIRLRMEGTSYRKMSEILALPESKVKSNLNKARQQLRKKINKLTKS
jgi:RNA polymerase sigma-70 factor (ECF subfamily)